MFRYSRNVLSTNEYSAGISLKNCERWQLNTAVVNDNGHPITPGERKGADYNPHNPKHAEHARYEASVTADVYPCDRFEPVRRRGV
jgi:hypothetical protein